MSVANLAATSNSVQKYCKEYATNQQAAEALLKNTIQSAVDDVIEGKFSPRATLEKIKNYSPELLPYLKEESLALVIKNIKYNVEFENLASKELISDATAIIEAFSEIYNQSEILKVLKSGLKTQETNVLLKNKLKDIFNTVMDRIAKTSEKYKTFQEQLPYLVKSNEYFSSVSEIDKETMVLVDLLESNVEKIASLCQSDEIKGWCYKITFENKEQLKKIARAFVLRFASEIMLESQFKHAAFNIFDFISISTKILSGFKTANI
jgi:hypothetical protein